MKERGPIKPPLKPALKLPAMQPLKSESIEAVGYDPATRELHIHFRNGGQYKYEDVSPEKHRALVNAESPGGVFRGRIKGLHKFLRYDSSE